MVPCKVCGLPAGYCEGFCSRECWAKRNKPMTDAPEPGSREQAETRPDEYLEWLADNYLGESPRVAFKAIQAQRDEAVALLERAKGRLGRCRSSIQGYSCSGVPGDEKPCYQCRLEKDANDFLAKIKTGSGEGS